MGDVVSAPNTVNVNSTDLSVLVGRFNAALASAKKSATDTVLHLCDAGDALIAAKERVGHGNWRSWLKRECDHSKAQAERFVRLAKHRNELMQTPHARGI